MNKILSLIMLLAMSTPAYAVVERSDNSMTLVYAFLGMCGMIVFLQILPVIAVAYGIVKGIFGKRKITS